MEGLINNVNVLVILTDWKEFKEYDWIKLIKKHGDKIKIYDGRNILIDQLNNYQNYFKL